ncbi:MAG: collagenase [Agarilytica sp.]
MECKRVISIFFFLLAVFFSSATFSEISPKKIERLKWWEVSSNNFTIISNGGKKRAVDLLRELEKFRSVVESFTNVRLAKDDRPLTVFAVKGNTAYSALMESIDSYKSFGGMYFERLEGDYAVVKLSNKKRSIEILFHEYVHYLTFLNPNVVIPYWYQEGIAVYLSLVTFDSKYVHLGQPDPGRLYQLNNMGWMPIEELLKKKFVKDKESDEFHQIYSQSWLFIHYLASNEERKQQLTNFLLYQKQGLNVDTSFRSAFGVEYEEMDRVLTDYRRRRGFTYYKLPLDQELKDISVGVERLSKSASLVHVGRFLSQVVRQNEKATRYFTLASEREETNAAAYAGMAYSVFRDDILAASEYAATGMEVGRTDIWVNYIYGKVEIARLKEVYGERLDGAPTKELNNVVRSLQIAMEGNEYIPALVELADLYWALGTNQQVLALLESASSYMPASFDINERLVRTYVREGRINDAYKIVDRMLNKAHINDKQKESIGGWVSDVMKDVPKRSPKSVTSVFESQKESIFENLKAWMENSDLAMAEVFISGVIASNGTFNNVRVYKSDFDNSDIISEVIEMLSSLDFGKQEVKETPLRYKFIVRPN